MNIGSYTKMREMQPWHNAHQGWRTMPIDARNGTVGMEQGVKTEIYELNNKNMCLLNIANGYSICINT